MQKKEIIKSLIKDFHHKPLPEFSPRAISIPLNLNKIISLIGARRSGKTYLLYQTIDSLLKQTEKSNIIFINLEDKRIDITSTELDLILQGYRELYPKNRLESCYFFFDEIQNVPGWEKFIRRLFDTISKHIYLTGSNAKMLSTEIATSLRGRSISYEVYPLSFSEYLSFKGIPFDLYVSETKGAVYNALETYLVSGGFPELLDVEDNDVKNRILQEYFDIMLFRDLVERYEIKNLIALKFFLKRLFASATKQVSINRIYNDLKSAGIKTGKNSLYDFMRMAESIFLVHTIKKYSPKISIQEFGERKVFIIDNGLLNAVIFQFSANTEKAMEQTVFWELKRRKATIYFLKNGFECDFITVSTGGIKDIIQVCHDISDPYTLKREVKGITRAAKKLGLKRGTIITYDQQDTMQENEVSIDIVPLPIFLCEH
ncbi:MAG: ATP-binding protein [Deltaproteobacteria bacterium]|nr:ATP-binding protein [Deltaproteobacteria bacterium]